MKFYKIILDNTIIGAINSNDFVRFSPVANQYITADEETGEYAEYNSKIYRSTWMRPIAQAHEYISANIIQIEEEEYNLLMAAIERNEIIYDDVTPSGQQDEIIDPIDTTSIDFIRSSKIKEMSYECNKTIENGFDIETEDGIHHYSYALEDQLNLMNLSSMIAQGANELSYHADGELCRFYTPEEINEIINAGNAWKTYHTTYFNALKSYINSLETIEEISAITYGVDIPDEFKTDVLKILEY